MRRRRALTPVDARASRCSRGKPQNRSFACSVPRDAPMDRPPSPLFRQVAIEAASGTQIGASLTTHWRGVAAFTAVAFALLAALIAFVAIVEYSPVHRVAAFVDARGGLVRLKAPLDGRVTRLAVADGAMVRKGDLLAVIGSERLREEGGGERMAVRQQLDAEKATIEREIEAARQEA